MGKFHLIESFYNRKQPTFRFEADVYDCEVEGEEPDAIRGTLYRVGPDTAYPELPGDNIINGDGMVSAFVFDDGHVDFRCRYVKTERLMRERAARRRLYGKYRNAFTDDASVAGTDRDNTWFNVKDQPIFAWAGLWRVSDEWGPVYSGVMTDCNEAIRPVHDRMPVLLQADEYDRWLNGSFDDLIAFQERCFPDNLIEMRRTDEPWIKRRTAEPVAS